VRRNRRSYNCTKSQSTVNEQMLQSIKKSHAQDAKNTKNTDRKQARHTHA